MKQLRISRELALPIEVAGEAIAILAKRGAGKTNTATVLVEELHAAGVQVVILDPVGAWWGIRSSADGKGEGLPIPILGGQHGDVPLEPTAGALAADVVVDHAASLLLDLSDFPSKRAHAGFVVDFAERLFRRKAHDRTLVHVVLEEADAFAPQTKASHDRVLEMKGAIEQIIRRGRSRGLGVTMITQRSAVLDKDVLEQADMLIVMRTTGPNDRKAIASWIDVHADREEAASVLDSLATLQTGEAWVWNPEHGVLERTRVRARQTFDSSGTPKAGERRTAPKKVAPIDLQALGAEIAATAERAKENDPAELRRRVNELQRELKRRDDAPTPVAETVEKVVEVPVLNGQLDTLMDGIRSMDDLAEKLVGAGQLVLEGSRMITTALTSATATAKTSTERKPAVPTTPARQARGTARREPSPTASSPAVPLRSADASAELGGGERKILASLASHFPMKVTRAQLGTLSGYSHRGGTFQKYFSILKREGLLEEYAGEITVTERGLDVFGGAPPAPKTPEELLEMWRRALEKGPRVLLDELVAAYPDELTREELGERTGYEASGGTFQKYLSILRRNELVVSSGGMVRATDALFGIGAHA